MATYEDFILRMKVQGADAVKQISGTIQDLKTDIESLSQVGGPLGNTINGLVGKFGALGLAATASVAAFAALGSRALQIAGEMADVSGATGIAAGTLMNFKNSVIDAGGKAEDFANIATKLNQSVQEAAAGNGKLQQAFKDLGVFVTDAGGQVRSTESILRDITNRFRSGEITSSQYAAAIDILGKNVSKLDLTKLEALKDPVADEAIQRLDKFNEVIDKIRARLEKGIVTFFLPALDQATKYYNYLEQQEKNFAKRQEEAATRGKAIQLDPRTGLPFERPLTSKEQADRAQRQLEQQMAAEMPSELARLRAKGPQAQGGFGATPKEEIERQKREREKAQNDAERLQRELDKQLKTVTGIGNAYQNSSEAAREKLNLEMATANMLEQERTLYAGIFEINRKANEAITKLEEQRVGARSETLALINQEIAAIEQQRQKEIETFTLSNERMFAKKREAQEIKNIIDLMEQQAEYAREIAEYQKQVDQARVAAFQQVRNIQEQLTLTTQQQQLERSIVNLRSEDQQITRDLFNLEQERRRNLEAIANIPDLPYADRLAKETEINAAYDARRQTLTQLFEQDKANQDNFINGWSNALERWNNNLKTDAERAAEAFGTITRGFEDSIVRFVQTGKLSFRSLFNDLIAQAVRASANRLLMSIFSGMLGGGTGGGFFSSLFGGFRANGGPVDAGRAYVVGEKGPELFVPRTGGAIVPNGAAMAGNTTVTNVNYSIQAVDASSFRSLVARDPEFIYSVTEQGRRQLPIRSRR